MVAPAPRQSRSTPKSQRNARSRPEIIDLSPSGPSGRKSITGHTSSINMDGADDADDAADEEPLHNPRNRNRRLVQRAQDDDSDAEIEAEVEHPTKRPRLTISDDPEGTPDAVTNNAPKSSVPIYNIQHEWSADGHKAIVTNPLGLAPPRPNLLKRKSTSVNIQSPPTNPFKQSNAASTPRHPQPSMSSQPRGQQPARPPSIPQSAPQSANSYNAYSPVDNTKANRSSQPGLSSPSRFAPKAGQNIRSPRRDNSYQQAAPHISSEVLGFPTNPTQRGQGDGFASRVQGAGGSSQFHTPPDISELSRPSSFGVLGQPARSAMSPPSFPHLDQSSPSSADLIALVQQQTVEIKELRVIVARLEGSAEQFYYEVRAFIAENKLAMSKLRV